MYYIVNHTQHIIAADSSLLELLSVSSIDELYTKIALGNIEFSKVDDILIITTENETLSYTAKTHELLGILGDISLVELSQDEEPSKSLDTKEDNIFSIEDDDSLNIFDSNDEENLIKKIIQEDNEELSKEEKPEEKVLFDDEPFELLSTEDSDEKVEEKIEENSNNEISFDDELFDLISDDEEKSEEVANKDDEKAPLDNELFDLISDENETKVEASTQRETIQEEEKSDDLLSIDDKPFELLSDEDEKEEEPETEQEQEELKQEEPKIAPISLDVESISQKIGISKDDYDTFLNEYIDTAFSLEKDLDSSDENKHSNAITTLLHLSNVLHLPMVATIVEDIRDSSSSERDSHIESLYSMLARLSTNKEMPNRKVTPETSTQTKEVSITPKDAPKEDAIKEDIIKEETIPSDEITLVDDNTQEDTVELVEAKEETQEPEKVELAEEKEEVVTTEGFGTIDLSDVKPIHFDFQIEAAANDLSLPVELIEEFVNDFIEQAHTETKKMLELYKKGDLDGIQKIGHLLKGTASNLRINPLADTLYEIQFCEDSNDLERLIKEYWAHFLSFETQINLISK